MSQLPQLIGYEPCAVTAPQSHCLLPFLLFFSLVFLSCYSSILSAFVLSFDLQNNIRACPYLLFSALSVSDLGILGSPEFISCLHSSLILGSPESEAPHHLSYPSYHHFPHIPSSFPIILSVGCAESSLYLVPGWHGYMIVTLVT